MIKSIKEILLGKKVKILEEDALEIAKQACMQEGSNWLEPVDVKLSKGIYKIWTNYGSRGGNFVISIDGNNGAILKKGFIRY